jgi:hypothetical protein
VKTKIVFIHRGGKELKNKKNIDNSGLQAVNSSAFCSRESASKNETNFPAQYRQAQTPPWL